jgi:hypothetical protein
MTDPIKITVYVETNKVGSRCEDEIEFDCDEWESMTEAEQDEACRDAAFNMLEWGWTKS